MVRPDRRQPDRSSRSRQARSCRRPLCRAAARDIWNRTLVGPRRHGARHTPRDHLSGHPPDPEARCGISGSDSGCLLMCQVSCHVILVCERISRPRYDMEDIMNSIHDVALYATGSRSNLTRARRRDHSSPSLSSSTRGWSRQSAPASMRRAPLISNMASWRRHQRPAGSGRSPQHAASRAGRVSRRRLV